MFVFLFNFFTFMQYLQALFVVILLSLWLWRFASQRTPSLSKGRVIEAKAASAWRQMLFVG